jgi:hypothetical protein
MPAPGFSHRDFFDPHRQNLWDLSGPGALAIDLREALKVWGNESGYSLI